MNHRSFTDGDEENIKKKVRVSGFIIAVGIIILTLGLIGQSEVGKGISVIVGAAVFGFGVISVLGAITNIAEATARLVAEAINEFLGEGKEAAALAEPAEPGTFRTVLFTDLVAHTEMMSRLGDERGRDVLREHETITRDVLKQHAGTEVKTMGDGFMASFDTRL